MNGKDIGGKADSVFGPVEVSTHSIISSMREYLQPVCIYCSFN